MTPPLLELGDLGVALGGRPVLRGIGATFMPGERVALVGPNGAGKTTLLRALAGLLPASGLLRLDGADLASVPRRLRARRIAYLPQERMITARLSVEEVVALGRLPHGGGPGRLSPADSDAVERALARTGLAGWRHRDAAALSLGERARVLLARALAVEAPILLADEPTAALDPRVQAEALDLLAGEARGGTLVVASLHDLSAALGFADRIFALQEGQLVADGPARQVMTDDFLAATFGVSARRGEADGLPYLAAFRVLPGPS